MIAEVTQGAGKTSCLAFLPKVIPFDALFYISDANADGNRLVVGVPSTDLQTNLAQIPLPGEPNEQFCERVPLGPGVYADAYVPTAAERERQLREPSPSTGRSGERGSVAAAVRTRALPGRRDSGGSPGHRLRVAHQAVDQRVGDRSHDDPAGERR